MQQPAELRSQIELYKCQHNDATPVPDATDPETWADLTQTSDVDGLTSGTKVRDATYDRGPYLERVPINPFNGFNTITVVATAAAKLADSTSGWCYVQATGEIFANDDGVTADGINYVDF